VARKRFADVGARQMWLIARGSDGTTGPRIALPPIVRDALVRWYVGSGSHGDEDAGIVLVQQARIGGKWIACDCLAGDRLPPILTPAFLSEAETYYLRRLTGQGRSEHHEACPFFRDQATNRVSEVRRPHGPADPPHGFFEALRPAPEKLAQRPDAAASDDRTRQASVPRLARLLWRLIDVAGLNCCPPLSQEPSPPTITDQFRSLTNVARGIEIGPGVELARVFWTHAQALRSRRVYAGLRALAPRWPLGHAPQAFLALYAHQVRGSTIHVAEGDPIVLANRVQTPSIRDNRIAGPFLVIVVVGEYPEAQGYAPLRGYAQPILSGRRFIPISSAHERDVLRALIAAREEFDRRAVDLHIEKPVFDLLTPLGACRPDFLIEARSRSTGECRQLVLDLGGVRDAHEVSSLERQRTIAPVVTLARFDPQAGVHRVLADALEM
jgi:hypothetical protein